MLSGYTLTENERKLERMYKEKNILTPGDLGITNVARLFGIELDFSLQDGPQRAIWDDETRLIFLNPIQSEEKQREVFFHELAHPLLHCGNQTEINNNFRDLQEHQANQFQLYAAIPFFMLKQLDLPLYESQIIELIKHVFKVPGSLVKKRLEQIKQRILQTKIDNDLYIDKVSDPKEPFPLEESFPILEDLFSQAEIKHFFAPQAKRKNKVYFDEQEGRKIPLWYCIDVNRGEVNWSQDFKLFPIDAEFEFIPISEMENKESDALSEELFLHPSYPNDFAVDLKLLKKKIKFYDVDPYNIRRFIINSSHLESLLQLDLFSSRLVDFNAKGVFTIN